MQKAAKQTIELNQFTLYTTNKGSVFTCIAISFTFSIMTGVVYGMWVLS